MHNLSNFCRRALSPKMECMLGNEKRAADEKNYVNPPIREARMMLLTAAQG